MAKPQVETKNLLIYCGTTEQRLEAKAEDKYLIYNTYIDNPYKLKLPIGIPYTFNWN